MSRIGKVPVIIPEKVEVKINGNTLVAKGPLGELSYAFHSLVTIAQKDNTIEVSPVGDSASAMWGTSRAVAQNMVIGVSEGYKKSLEIK